MKIRVVREDFNEIEIRPKKDFKTYLSLIEKDVKNILGNKAGNYLFSCPACNSEITKFSFSKNGFVYRECQSCGTVFMTPRPTINMLHDFYLKSKGLSFWNSIDFQESIERKEYVFEPRIRWIEEAVEFTKESSRNFLDFYSKYSILCNKLSKLSLFNNKDSYKPIKNIKSEIAKAGFNVIDTLKNKRYSVITAFEVFDRFYDPQNVIKRLSEIIEVGGLLFISTKSSSGLEFQILKAKSQNLIPPIHLNIFSVEGMISLLENNSFEIIELSTPGSLDLKIIEEQINEVELPKFIKDILLLRNKSIKESFQEFLQRALLSSHMRILAKKIN